jgi:long-chain acyl-CoA synthetase
MSDPNLASLQRRQTQRLGPRVALRYRRHGLYHDLTWNEYYQRTLACAAALIEAGIQRGDRVGLWAENRLEWLLADMGLLAAGAINVPAHSTLAPQQVQGQFTHAEVSWLFVASRQQLDQLRPLLPEMPGIRGIVSFDEVAEPGVQPWSAFVAKGNSFLPAQQGEIERRLSQVTRDDLATIMYTSGTTGNPKGVMLTHGNLLSNAQSMLEGCGVDEHSVVLGWLPFSHIYARLVDHYVHLAAGSTLCLAESQELLLQNILETQPTSLSAVPRFYEKVLAGYGPAKLKSVFGGRIQWLNSGGAPLPLHIAQAYIDAGLLMLQGYGLTESSPVISFNRRESNRLGTVGLPVPGVEIKIAADGEVLTRGPHVMKGYWKDPKATAETIQDGWLCTGDLGQLDQDGYLSITGRKKDLMVLSNGKKVIPTELEGLLLSEPCIDQAVIYGEGKHFLTALIVPNFEKLRAAVRGAQSDPHKLVQQSEVQTLMTQRIAAALANVASYEKVQKFILLPRPFSQEADELTVSLKLRRGVILKKYREQLEALYK